MADPIMPDAIVQWLRQRNWGMHHLEWHVTRLWDARQEMRQFAQSRGWNRAPIQEGSPGNGLEFLAMHRVMIRQLIESFPQHIGLFRGWQTPPTNPNDANDPVPAGSLAGGPFDTSMLAAISKIEGSPPSFTGDDVFGLYLESNRRPTPSNPQQSSSDPSTGIHNYLHARFSDSSSPINMGDPQVNLLNQRFWRLHGWIDGQWSRVRASLALSDDDPAYQAALRDAEHHMGGHMMAMMAPLIARQTFAIEPVALPETLRRGLFSWGGKEEKMTTSKSERPSTPKFVDFEDAQVHLGISEGSYVLSVSGKKNYLNMTVHLAPRTYVRQPEYWEIEVIGVLTGIGLPAVGPYSVSLPLDGITGTKGIEVVGASRRQQIEVPPLRSESPAPTWEGDAGQNNGVKNLFRTKDIEHMKSDVVVDLIGVSYALDDYEDVKRNAIKIFGMLKSRRMPPDAPWENDKLSKFKSWMDAGFPKG